MIVSTLALGLAFALCALSFVSGYHLGRVKRESVPRAISPSTPHPAPSIARRAERIAKQAIHRKDAPASRIISPRKKAESALGDIES